MRNRAIRLKSLEILRVDRMSAARINARLFFSSWKNKSETGLQDPTTLPER
jgi:hypothetical protein